MATATSAGGMRAKAILDRYDPDEASDRVYRLLMDLADYCTDVGLPHVELIASNASHAADHARRS